MKVSNRQRRILEVLLESREEVTAGRLAEEAQISARTVHRELQELEPLLAEFGLSLVRKSGIGIALEGQEHQVIRFQEALRVSETETYSPEERKVLLLCGLLEEKEPVKLFALAREVLAAIPTVSRDLDDTQPLLSRSGLELIRKRGYGVEIDGPEEAKREFIARMAEEYSDHSDWFGAADRQGEQPSVTRRLLGLAGKIYFHRIEQFLWQQAEEWLNKLSESDYTRLLIRLSAAVNRIRHGHRIGGNYRDAGFTEAGGGVWDTRRLASMLELDIPDEEAAYLRSLVEQARERAADLSSVILEKYGLELAERAVAFIQAAENRLHVGLSRDRSLLDGLIRHLGPALARIREGAGIRNPLLPQIRKDYGELFEAVRSAAMLTWPDLNLPEEEIGYLTMHFGAALERWKLMPGGIRAMMVCTSGIGSSKLLAVRVSKEIPQIDLIGHYSWYEASRIPEDQYDLIISTVDLPLAADRYVRLSPLLTREEAEKLRAHIRQLPARRRAGAAAEQRREDGGAWERLRLTADYYAETARILETFRVRNLDNRALPAGSLSLLQAMIRKAAPVFAPERPDRIVQALLEREKQGSLLIPDTGLALYHTRSEEVRQPVLMLFRLAAPHAMEEEADPAPVVREILLMLAPKALGKEGLEVLSEISAMLLEPELVLLLETEEETRIRAYLARRLETYIQKKWEWREAT